MRQFVKILKIMSGNYAPLLAYCGRGTIKQFMTILAVLSRRTGATAAACMRLLRAHLTEAAIAAVPNASLPPSLPPAAPGRMRRHCIVAKTDEARNKIYAVVFVNAKLTEKERREWQAEWPSGRAEAAAKEMLDGVSASQKVCRYLFKGDS